MVEAGVTPYARTGTRIFGKTHSVEGAEDPVAMSLNGRVIGGLQGRQPQKLSINFELDTDILIPRREKNSHHDRVHLCEEAHPDLPMQLTQDVAL